ncbi:MAG: NADH-quinone oxidoreductase subunit NuoH [Armatimonadetes bacterium]|nr:NADH-quinone oxidoreductase subunit NuoH [Armatimonadota bacterium]
MSLLRSILTAINEWLNGLLTSWGMPEDWARLLVEILAWCAGAVFAIAVMMFAALVLVYLERKVAGYIQARVGPTRVGPIGLFQTPMDAIKLLLKEDIVPIGADKILHAVAPVLFFTVSLMAWAVIPWDKDVVVGAVLDQNVGVLYLLGVSGITVIAMLMGGWGSNNKWSLIGAVRAGAQMLSYEIPLLLSLLCVVLVAESLSFGEIVNRQSGGIIAWNIFRPWLWLPALLFIIAMFAEVARQPFDLPEAESELVAGYHTEYSGMKFALFFLGEYANILLISVVVAVVFLGGWLSPFGPGDTIIPGIVWLFAKAALLIFFVLWVRWTLPRMRPDQMMSLSWKFMVPAGFVALAITTACVALIPGA